MDVFCLNKWMKDGAIFLNGELFKGRRFRRKMNTVLCFKRVNFEMPIRHPTGNFELEVQYMNVVFKG